MRLRFLYIAVFIFLTSCRFGEPSITIVVESIPPYNTSKTAIYMAGNFNDWNPKDEDYRLNWLGGEKFGLELKVPENFTDSVIEYKYTHGSWDNVEVTKEGKDIPNRKLPNLKKSITALDKIESWEKPKVKSTALPTVKVWKEAMEIPQLQTTRRIWVCLPSDYADSDQKYPVIYLHDGQNLFDSEVAPFGEWQVDETMQKLAENTGFSAIVVGIDHGDTARISEYSPYKHPKYGGGKGTAYLDFLVENLKPQIDAEFRTLADRENTAIGGSSMGGLISFVSAIEHNQTFSKFLIFSPSLWFSEQVYKDAKKLAKSEPIKMYMLVGEQEGKTDADKKQMVEGFQKMTNQLKGVSTLEIQTKQVADGEHNEEFWRNEFGNGLKWLFQTN